MPIIASEFNPRDSILTDSSWPSPPSALGRQVDSEMGAAYVLSAFKYMSLAGQTGNACFAALDNFSNAVEYPSGDWGARTHYVLNQIRKAVYHGLSIAGKMKRTLVETDLVESNSSHEYFDHFYTMAGVDNRTMTILSWNYVVCPFYEVWYTLVAIGYDWNRWGGSATMRLYYDGYIPVEDLTSDPQEQIDLEWSKRIYQRQRTLVTEIHSATYDVQGFYPYYGVHVTQYLIDATHSNSYYHYVTSGLPMLLTTNTWRQ